MMYKILEKNLDHDKKDKYFDKIISSMEKENYNFHYRTKRGGNFSTIVLDVLRTKNIDYVKRMFALIPDDYFSTLIHMSSSAKVPHRIAVLVAQAHYEKEVFSFLIQFLEKDIENLWQRDEDLEILLHVIQGEHLDTKQKIEILSLLMPKHFVEPWLIGIGNFFQMAIDSEDREMIDFMIDHCCLERGSSFHRFNRRLTPLQLALRIGDLDTAGKILEKSKRSGYKLSDNGEHPKDYNGIRKDAVLLLEHFPEYSGKGVRINSPIGGFSELSFEFLEKFWPI